MRESVQAIPSLFKRRVVVSVVAERLQHIGRACGLGVRQLDEHQQPAGALDQCAHGARNTGISLTFDEVAFPVSRELSVFTLRWPQVNAEHVGNLAPSVLARGLALCRRCWQCLWA